MPKKAMDGLTESMFYLLMALYDGEKCGIEAAQWMEKHSGGRMKMGPATLYTLLGKFEKEKNITETQVEGRKRTYSITQKGREAYVAEVERLKRCLSDAIAAKSEKGEAK